jgi:penicillin amidase
MEQFLDCSICRCCQQPTTIHFTPRHAKTKQIFKRGGSYFSPGLNVMYGDAKGNIAWWATGKLYKHNDGVDTHFILDGSSGKDDITEYMDFSKIRRQ